MAATFDLFGKVMGPPEPQPRAQLTVFYSGTVNVYDNVPADKAHAIMLLLHSNRSNQTALTSSEEHVIPPNPKDVDPAPSLPSCETTVNNSAMVRPSSTSCLRELVQPLSRSSTPPPRPSSPFTGQAQIEKKQQIVCKRSQAELPFARKASLARFLEKRKDRVQPKVEQVDANHSEKKMKPTVDNEMPR